MKKILLIFYFTTLFGNLLHPPNNSELSQVHVMFKWEPENNTTSYMFELSNKADFSSLLISKTITDTSHIIKENISWQSTYHWRVKPSGGEYLTSFS